MGNEEESTILEKRDKEADERKIMIMHGLVRDGLIQQLREEAALSVGEQVSERINRQHQIDVPRFYNFKERP